MRSFEACETEVHTARATVEVAALRPHSERAAAELRRTLPALLAGIVAEIDGAELEFGMLTDTDGMVAVELTVSAGEHTGEAAAELGAALERVAEVAVATDRTDRAALAEWSVVVDDRPGRIGFGESALDAVMPWHVGGDELAEQLIEDLAATPGHGLRVRLRASSHRAQPHWTAQLRVVTVAGAPSLRLRSALRRRFPGLKVEVQQGVSPMWLRVQPSDLPEVLAFPIAGGEPLAGAYLAAAAPIPVVPPRPGTTALATGIRLGRATTGGGRPVPVMLTDSERLRHVHVLGRTGTGKSSALAGMVHELAARGEGALIADPHGQLCDRILAELPDAARERVWVIRCGDVANPVPLNPIAVSDPVRRDIAIADVCASFQYLFDKKESGIVGPRFVERVAMTMRALAAVHGTRASLLDVPFAAADESFMDDAVEASTDDRLKVWWRTHQLEKRSSEHGQVLAWVNSKFEGFAATAAMRAILGSGVNAIDFAEAMDDGRIILLDLSKSALGEQASRLLGFLYLGRVWEAALRRVRSDRPFTVIVDEAHALISGALTNMLAEGRKFGIAVVIAHQYLEQLDDDLRPAVGGNVATTIAFRCDVGDASELGRRFGGLVDTSTLVTLPDLTAVALRTAASGPAYPHTLVIDHNERASGRRGAALDGHTRAVMTATWADLVDAHRDVTAAAADGVSNVKSLGATRRPVQPPALKPAAAGSFLDEWMAKRAARAQQGGDRTMPAGGGSVSVVSEPPAEGDPSCAPHPSPASAARSVPPSPGSVGVPCT